MQEVEKALAGLVALFGEDAGEPFGEGGGVGPEAKFKDRTDEYPGCAGRPHAGCGQGEQERLPARAWTLAQREKKGCGCTTNMREQVCRDVESVCEDKCQDHPANHEQDEA